MTPELSRRLGRAMGTKYVTLDEQNTIRQAALSADQWADLPAAVRALIEEIESRPDLWT